MQTFVPLYETCAIRNEELFIDIQAIYSLYKENN